MAATSGPLIVIVGQTASGKSALAMELAQKFNGEIICADARTVYKGMDIGTAKPSLADQQRIPHHLLDILEPSEKFTAAEFKQRAIQIINDITDRGRLPILVGGTGLYVDAVLFDYQFSQSSAERDPQNPRHLKPPTKAVQTRTMRANTLVLGSDIEKPVLDKRIAERVQDMLSAGLEAEVRAVAEKYSWQSPGLSAIGYKEWNFLFNGAVHDPQDIAQMITKNTVAYAKRQKTWFRRNKSIQWITNSSEAVEIATTFLNKTTK